MIKPHRTIIRYDMKSLCHAMMDDPDIAAMDDIPLKTDIYTIVSMFLDSSIECLNNETTFEVNESVGYFRFQYGTRDNFISVVYTRCRPEGYEGAIFTDMVRKRTECDKGSNYNSLIGKGFSIRRNGNWRMMRQDIIDWVQFFHHRLEGLEHPRSHYDLQAKVKEYISELERTREEIKDLYQYEEKKDIEGSVNLLYDHWHDQKKKLSELIADWDLETYADF